jgi:hypothetical protein
VLRLEDNIEMDIQIWCEDVDWIWVGSNGGLL